MKTYKNKCHPQKQIYNYVNLLMLLKRWVHKYTFSNCFWMQGTIHGSKSLYEMNSQMRNEEQKYNLKMTSQTVYTLYEIGYDIICYYLQYFIEPCSQIFVISKMSIWLSYLSKCVAIYHYAFLLLVVDCSFTNSRLLCRQFSTSIDF